MFVFAIKLIVVNVFVFVIKLSSSTCLRYARI